MFQTPESDAKVVKKPDSQTGGAVTAQEQSTRFNRNVFLIDNSLGTPALDKKLHPIKASTELQREAITFTPELKKRFTIFLRNYVENLSLVYNSDPTVFQNPNHIHDREILGLLGITNRDAKYDISSVEGDAVATGMDAKIEAFLNKPEGWILAIQLLEHQTSMKLFALGLDSQLKPQGSRNSETQEMSLPMNVNRGRWANVLQSAIDRVNPVPAIRAVQAANRNAVAATSLWSFFTMVGGIAVGVANTSNPVTGAIAGALGGAATGVGSVVAARKLFSQFQSGTMFTVEDSKSMIHALQQDPRETEFVRRMFNVPIDQYAFNAAGEILTAPQLTIDPLILEREVIQGIATRIDFYAALGIPVSKLDAIPEQCFLHEPDPQNPRQEQLGVRWQQLLDNEFDSTDPQDIVRNADGTVNRVETLQRFRTARARVLCTVAQDFFIREEKGKATDNTIANLEAKQKIFSGEDATGREKKNEKITKEKVALERLLVTNNEHLNAFSPLDAAVSELVTIRNDASGEFSQVFHEEAFINEIDTLIQKNKDELMNAAGNAGLQYESDQLEEQRDTEIENALKQLDTQLATTYANTSKVSISAAAYQERQTRVIEGVSRRFAGRLARLRTEIENRTGNITRLTAIKNSYNTKLSVMVISERNIVQSAPRISDAMYNAREIFAVAAAGGGTISESDLRDLSAEALTPRLIAPPYNILNGTPEEKRKLNELVLNAKAEQRALEMFPLIEGYIRPQYMFEDLRAIGAQLPLELQTIDSIIDLPQREIEVRLRGVNNLPNLLKARDHANGDRLSTPAGNDPYTDIFTTPDLLGNFVRSIKQEAQRQLRIRYREHLKIEKATLEAGIKQCEAKLGISTEAEAQKIKLTVDLLRDKENIYARSHQAAIGEVDSNTGVPEWDLFDINAIDPNVTPYNAAEIARTPVVGYLEMLQLLFNYQDSTNRGERFEEAFALLPPDKMGNLIGRWIYDYSPLGAPAANFTLNGVLAELRRQMVAGQISGIEIRSMVKYILDKLADEAKAL